MFTELLKISNFFNTSLLQQLIIIKTNALHNKYNLFRNAECTGRWQITSS